MATVLQAQFEYITNSGTITITGYTGTGGFVSIPSSINDLPVTIIGINAFAESQSGPWTLTGVSIPDSVTTIGPYAFEYCENLTNVTIPPNVTLIGEAAFSVCENMADLTIGAGVTSIADFAFSACYALTNLTIPDNVTSIGEAAFADCSSVNELIIPASVATIGDGAFGGCTALTNLTIPASATSIGREVFWYCGLTSVTIPENVTNLGPFAFAYCGSLTNVIFAGNAPSVDASFNGDTNATVYYLPGTTGWSFPFAPDAEEDFPGLPGVLWNPVIQPTGSQFGVKDKQFGFDISGSTNIPILVQASSNLAGTKWVLLQSLKVTNGLVYFSDPQWTNYSARYYRIVPP